jgi:hypothetical protein
VALAKRHQSIAALPVYRSDDPFRVGVRVGRLKRRLHDLHAGIPEQPSHIAALFPITIADEHAMIA